MTNNLRLVKKYKENEYDTFSESISSDLLNERINKSKQISALVRNKVVYGFEYQMDSLKLFLSENKLLAIYLSEKGVDCSVSDCQSENESKYSMPNSDLHLESPYGRKFVWGWKSLMDSAMNKVIGYISASETSIWLYLTGFTIFKFVGYRIDEQDTDLLFFDIDQDEIQAAEIIQKKSKKGMGADTKKSQSE